MALKAVQQIMLGKVTKTEDETFRTLMSISQAGYDGTELCGFMIRPASLFVRALAAAAGMPAGRGGNRVGGDPIKSLQLSAGHLNKNF